MQMNGASRSRSSVVITGLKYRGRGAFARSPRLMPDAWMRHGCSAKAIKSRGRRTTIEKERNNRLIERQRDNVVDNESKRKGGNESETNLVFTRLKCYIRREGRGNTNWLPHPTPKKKNETEDGSIESIIPFAKSIHRKSLIT